MGPPDNNIGTEIMIRKPHWGQSSPGAFCAGTSFTTGVDNSESGAAVWIPKAFAMKPFTASHARVSWTTMESPFQLCRRGACGVVDGIAGNCLIEHAIEMSEAGRDIRWTDLDIHLHLQIQGLQSVRL
jgi:hypothetical protein